MNNYRGTFIQIADDSFVREGAVPAAKGERKTVALLQYELLSENPYAHTQEEVLFEANLRHKGLAPDEQSRAELWDAFFAQPKACLRASPLPKKYGWGIHFDEVGKAALSAVESDGYGRLAQPGKGGPTVLKAMRNRSG